MKTYPSTTRDEFYRDHTFAVDLVELFLPSASGGTMRLNTGGVDLTFNSNTFTAQGDFIGFSKISEDFDVKVGKFTIYLSGLGTGMISKFIGNNVEGSRVKISKAFLDLNTLDIIDNPVLLFDGSIYNIAITETERSCQINIDCSTLFADFERTAGRMTNNWSNWLYQGLQYDTSMEKSGYVGNTEFLWGRIAK
jgi:hypothetical protein